MRHVFVETNRVYSYSAPAHHKELEAVDLLNRARSGDVRMQLPAICLTEARRTIAVKCQPRREADAIRRFLSRARAEQVISPEQERIVREVLVRFEQQVREELSGLDTTPASLRDVGGLELFPLNERMLERAVELSGLDLSLQPFDQAILAAVLVRAEELGEAGETVLLRNRCRPAAIG
jgi:hypothetical protein